MNPFVIETILSAIESDESFAYFVIVLFSIIFLVGLGVWIYIMISEKKD